MTCLKTCDSQGYSALPDGIYTIELLSNFKDISKKGYYLKTDQFDEKLSKVYIDRGLRYDPIKNKEFIRGVYKIKAYIEQAKAYSKEGDFIEAQRYFNEAVERLNEYTDCVNCK